MGGMIGDPGDYDGPEGLAARLAGVTPEAWEALGVEPFAGSYREANDEVIAMMGGIVRELRGAGLPDGQIRAEVTLACENLAARGVRDVPAGPLRELIDRALSGRRA